MTVAELIEALREMPEDMIVMTTDYEEGSSPVTVVSIQAYPPPRHVEVS